MAIRHTHVSCESSDCDGRYSRGWITEGENSFAIAVFDALPLTEGTDNGKPDVSLGYSDDDLYIAHVSYPTDEGGCAYEIVECNRDCDLGESLFRDHSAESAGY